MYLLKVRAWVRLHLLRDCDLVRRASLKASVVNVNGSEATDTQLLNCLSVCSHQVQKERPY